MLTEVMQKHSVLKLRGVLKDRYGLGFQMTSMISSSDLEVTDQGHMRSELRGSSLHVPICARGKYLATAVLTRAELLSNRDRHAVSEMVKLVLEPALYSTFIELQSTNAKIHKDEIGNLLILDPLMQLNTGLSWNDGLQPEFNASLILLESFNPHTIARVAVHIHETGDRWAMLRYTEIKDSLNSLADLREMGAMTLLIEDLLQLSPSMQELLASFAANSNPETEPLILLGCTSKLDDLIRQNVVHPEMLKIIQESRLQLDRMPQDFSKLRETVEMALDKHSFI